jgi:hypothetical protein
MRGVGTKKADDAEHITADKQQAEEEEYFRAVILGGSSGAPLL